MAEESQPTPAEQFEADYAGDPDPEPEPAPEEAEPAPVAIKHPAYLVNMARKSGFSDEELASIPTDHLGLMIERIQENTRQIAEQAGADAHLIRATGDIDRDGGHDWSDPASGAAVSSQSRIALQTCIIAR